MGLAGGGSVNDLSEIVREMNKDMQMQVRCRRSMLRTSRRGPYGAVVARVLGTTTVAEQRALFGALVRSYVYFQQAKSLVQGARAATADGAGPSSLGQPALD